jgi:hypothetical protein
MAKKKDSKRNIHTEGGSYYERIEIENGDFVGGSKEIKGGDGSIVAGKIEADSILLNSPPAPGATVDDLLQALAQWHALVKEMPLPRDEAEVIEGDFQVIEQQLAQEQPRKHLILPKLKSILELVTAAGAASQALPKVVEMGENVVAWVQALL